jgi:hypothetical protein
MSIIHDFHHAQTLISIVRTGGQLYEYYLDIFAPPTLHKRWKRAKALAIASGDYMQEEEEDAISVAIESKYYGFIIQSVLDLYRNSKWQRFYVSFVSKYHGLSKLGMDILSSWGYAMPSTSYDRHLITHMEDAAVEYK